jgi:hypothetical protein
MATRFDSQWDNFRPWVFHPVAYNCTKYKKEEMSAWRWLIASGNMQPYEIYHHMYSCDRLTFPFSFIWKKIQIESKFRTRNDCYICNSKQRASASVLFFVEYKYSIRFGKKLRLRQEQFSEFRVKLIILILDVQILSDTSNYFLLG